MSHVNASMTMHHSPTPTSSSKQGQTHLQNCALSHDTGPNAHLFLLRLGAGQIVEEHLHATPSAKFKVNKAALTKEVFGAL
jgi:mevalonate pyrophosphate decarboxylase